MSLIFKATNPGSSFALWPSVTSWKRSRYFDKPGSLKIDLAGGHGIAERAIVEAYYESEDGADSFSDIAFRGIVMPSDDKFDDTSSLTIPSIERLLDYRYTQVSRYPASTTLNTILSSTAPTGTNTPGILWQANSLIPQGAFQNISGSIYKLTGGGKTSRLGDIHAAGDTIYRGYTKLTWAGSYAGLNANDEYWQDNTDLYVYTAKDPGYSLIGVSNWKDTLIRLGTISLGSSTFTQSWRTGNEQVYKHIIKLLQAYGLEYQFRHAADGYTYLDAQATIGRGASHSFRPTFSYETDAVNITALRKTTTGGKLPIHALRGLGAGKGAARKAYSAVSLAGSGPIFEALEEYSSQFSTQLKNTIDKRYNDIQDLTSWEIQAPNDPALVPGDYVLIIPRKDGKALERIKEIDDSSDGLMKLFAGQRPLDAEDILRAKFDVRDALQRDLEQQETSWSGNGQENVDSATACNILIKVPSENWDNELDSKWLLSITMNEFESSISQATTPEVSHGADGTETTSGSDGEHTDHNLSGKTTAAASGSLVQAAAYAACADASDDTGCDDSTDHYHDLGGGYNATMSDHTHGFANPTYPGEAAAHTVPTKVNPEQDASLAQNTLKASGFGSLAYLTVTVKIINATYPAGQAVSGSPFEDIALAEQIADIDVTGLIVAGDNKINIAIAKYGGTGSVRARASVTLTGKHFVDSYYI